MTLQVAGTLMMEGEQFKDLFVNELKTHRKEGIKTIGYCGEKI